MRMMSKIIDLGGILFSGTDKVASLTFESAKEIVTPEHRSHIKLAISDFNIV